MDTNKTSAKYNNPKVNELLKPNNDDSKATRTTKRMVSNALSIWLQENGQNADIHDAKVKKEIPNIHAKENISVLKSNPEKPDSEKSWSSFWNA